MAALILKFDKTEKLVDNITPQPLRPAREELPLSTD
jgi:hypothetical protein